MSAEMMIPASLSSMVITNDAGFASSSGFSVVQPNSMNEAPHHQSPEILSNASKGLMQQPMEAYSGNFDVNFGLDDEDNFVNEESGTSRPNKRQRYHRHTQHQIQELEACFKQYPHPDDKLRKELSRRLGMEPLQIKFWFQNKRTQLKAQNERQENEMLRAENEKLRTENMELRIEVGNIYCPQCSSPLTTREVSSAFVEQEARIENAQLKAEIERLSAMAAKYKGKRTVTSNDVHTPPQTRGDGNLGGPTSAGQLADKNNVNVNVGWLYGNGAAGESSPRSINCPTGEAADKSTVTNLAVMAMDELLVMAQMKEPLWVAGGIDGATAFLDRDEYFNLFPRGIEPNPRGFKTEVSRETAVVIMNHLQLVDLMMNVSHWATMFSSIVSRAVTVDVLSTGLQAGSHNGAMLLIYAEFEIPTPLVPARDCYFVRYCKKTMNGTWAVVDVSLDQLCANAAGRCRKRPSGCLIQELPNGYSKVTWVEHVEVEDNDELYGNIYKQLIDSGFAFGAKRWIATLDRQCERAACGMAPNVPTTHNLVIGTPQGRRSILRLAERMVYSFCSGVCSSTSHQWTLLSGTASGDVRIMIRKSVDDPGRPAGIVLSASTSFWLPVQPNKVFDFLRNHLSRTEWDILSNCGAVTEVARMANGRENGNCVSLLRVNSGDSTQSNMLILQESITDPTASYVIYAPVDLSAMNNIIGGGDPDRVPLLPSGFAILPDGPPPPAGGQGTSCGGSLLTVSFQILVDSVPTAKLSAASVATVNQLIQCTTQRIKTSLSDVLGPYD